MGNSSNSLVSNKYRNVDNVSNKNIECTPDFDAASGSSIAFTHRKGRSVGCTGTSKYSLKSKLQSSFATSARNSDTNESKNIETTRECDKDSATPPSNSLFGAEVIMSGLGMNERFCNNKACKSQRIIALAGNDHRKLHSERRKLRTPKNPRDFLSTSKILELFPDEKLQFRHEFVTLTPNDGGSPRKVAVRAEDRRWKLICLPTKSFTGVLVAQKQIYKLFPFGRIEFHGTLVTHTTLNGETREVAIREEDGRLLLLDHVKEELDII